MAERFPSQEEYDQDASLRVIRRRKDTKAISEQLRDEEKYGPYAYNLYRESLQAGVEEDSSIRVNVVGNFGQGKTSLVRRLIRSNIDRLESTNGIDIVHYKCKQDSSGNITYEESAGFDSSDIAKRIKKVSFAKRTEKKRKSISKSIKQCFVNPFKKRWIERVKQAAVYIPKEMSQIETEIYVSEVIESDDQYSSDGSLKSFDIWDFGGQYVFYATHTLFHSRKAIYFLVFNLSCGLTDIVPDDSDEICMGKRTMEFYIKFWVNSIHSFAGNKDGTEPKIILVGTHFDNLKGNNASKKRQADRYFDDIRSLFKGKQQSNHFFPKEFALDNRNIQDDKFDDLREQILLIGQQYVNSTKVPAKWIQLERYLSTYKQEKIVHMTKLFDIDPADEYPLSVTEQIKLFLKHKHDQGTLFYFDEEPISDYVVLDPQFLVDAFKCIITADRFVRNMPGVNTSWEKLTSEGQLETSLVDALWENAADKKIMKHKQTILWFLQKHRIISEAMAFDEKEQKPVGLGWYVVPSLLKDYSEVAEMNHFLRGKKQTQIKFVISFESSSIVPTIYHRLAAAILGKWLIQHFRAHKLLFENMSVVRLDDHHAGITEMNDRHIQLIVLNLCPSYNVKEVVPDAFRRFVENVILYEFRKYQGVKEHMFTPYERGFACNHAVHTVARSTTVVQYQQLNSRIVPCPDAESHEINAVVAKAEWFQGAEMPKIISEKTMSDKILSRLSQVIGQNWKFLGHELNLNETKIDHIIEENPHSTSMRIYKMLRQWRDSSPDTASLNKLVKVLQKCPSINVEWDEIRNIIEELNEHEQSKLEKEIFNYRF